MKENTDKSDWKEENSKYINEISKFLDKVQNVEDEELRLSIIYQMLKCDKILTDISEEMFKKEYERGKKEAKKDE